MQPRLKRALQQVIKERQGVREAGQSGMRCRVAAQVHAIHRLGNAGRSACEKSPKGLGSQAAEALLGSGRTCTSNPTEGILTRNCRHISKSTNSPSIGNALICRDAVSIRGHGGCCFCRVILLCVQVQYQTCSSGLEATIVSTFESC